MSFKSKNLSYEAKEPAFLQRLRAQQAGFDTDRQERPVARPKRLKTSGEDDEDAPTYVDAESNQTLSKEDYEALVASESAGGKEVGNDEKGELRGDDQTSGAQTEPKRQEVTEVGQSQRKRKIVKAVGAIETNDDTEAVDAPSGSIPKNNKKPKKKTKAVKLSFNDAEH